METGKAHAAVIGVCIEGHIAEVMGEAFDLEKFINGRQDLFGAAAEAGVTEPPARLISRIVPPDLPNRPS